MGGDVVFGGEFMYILGTLSTQKVFIHVLRCLPRMASALHMADPLPKKSTLDVQTTRHVDRLAVDLRSRSRLFEIESKKYIVNGDEPVKPGDAQLIPTAAQV